MQIEKLIKKFYLGKLTNMELTFLLSHLKDKEPSHELLELYQRMWDRADGTKSNINSEDIYNKVVNKVEVRLKSVTGSPAKVGFRGYVGTLMRYAAVFILSFGLSWLVHSFFISKTNSVMIADQIHRVEVPYGSKSRIILPDSSVVTLNSGSSLKYSSSDFSSGSRSVSLTGEGFFSVTKDSTRPFYVTTSGMKVKVLGTTFNLKAYPEENIEEATLVTGKVEIYASIDIAEEGKPIVLSPNQNAIFIKSRNSIPTGVNPKMDKPEIIPVELRTIELQPVSTTEQIISWKDNMLVFDNETFRTLAVKLERWYNVNIVVNYPELNSIRFTGKFDKETLEQVLKALVTVTPFNYDIKQNLITISKK